MARELNLVASDTHAVAKITCPSPEVADTLAAALVESRAAACVNIVPGVTSIYRWQGQTQRDSEVLLLVKTTLEKGRDVLRLVGEHHPYTVPEVIWVPVCQGSQSYLDWLTECVGADS